MAKGIDVCDELSSLGMFASNKGIVYNSDTKQFTIYRNNSHWTTGSSLEDITHRGAIAVQFQGLSPISSSYWSATAHGDNVRFWTGNSWYCIITDQDKQACFRDNYFNHGENDKLDFVTAASMTTDSNYGIFSYRNIRRNILGSVTRVNRVRIVINGSLITDTEIHRNHAPSGISVFDVKPKTFTAIVWYEGLWSVYTLPIGSPIRLSTDANWHSTHAWYGCPVNLCIDASLDAVISRPMNMVEIIRGHWSWKFSPGPNTVLPIATRYYYPLQTAIIDTAFMVGMSDFIITDDVVISPPRSSPTNTTFIGHQGRIDAAFSVHDHVTLFSGNLMSEYRHLDGLTFEQVDNMLNIPIRSQWLDFPYSVDSAFVQYDVLTVTSGSFLIRCKLNVTECFEPLLIQNYLFKCDDSTYLRQMSQLVPLQIKTFDHFHQYKQKFKPNIDHRPLLVITTTTSIPNSTPTSTTINSTLPLDDQPNNTRPSGNRVSLIVGIVLGVLLFLLVIGVVAAMFDSRRSRSRNSGNTSATPDSNIVDTVQ